MYLSLQHEAITIQVLKDFYEEDGSIGKNKYGHPGWIGSGGQSDLVLVYKRKQSKLTIMYIDREFGKYTKPGAFYSIFGKQSSRYHPGSDQLSK